MCDKNSPVLKEMWQFSHQHSTLTCIRPASPCHSHSLHSAMRVRREQTHVRTFSVLCARYGRRFILLLSIALQTVFGVAVAFAPNFEVYVILRFVVGATISGVIINAFVLGTDSDTSRTRHYISHYIVEGN